MYSETMDALQFSIMHTINDTFRGIRSKALVECAHLSCKWYLCSLKGSFDVDNDIVNAFSSINAFDVHINCQSV